MIIILINLMALTTIVKFIIPVAKMAFIPLIITKYFHEKHVYDMELLNRMNFIHAEEKAGRMTTSGIYLQQRQPFGFLWLIQWWLPYHQSLKIEIPNTADPTVLTVRQVGLGNSPIKTSFFDWTSEFILHEGIKYEQLNKSEMSIPIEAWVDYKRLYGHYPMNINPKVLNQVTMTRHEAGNDANAVKNLYHVNYGSFTKDNDGNRHICSCRSAVMYAVRETERRQEEMNHEPMNKLMSE